MFGPIRLALVAALLFAVVLGVTGAFDTAGQLLATSFGWMFPDP